MPREDVHKLVDALPEDVVDHAGGVLRQLAGAPHIAASPLHPRPGPKVKLGRHPEGDIWRGPAKGWLGGEVALDALVAYTDCVAIAVRHVVVYPNGVEFTVRIEGRPGVDMDGAWASLISIRADELLGLSARRGRPLDFWVRWMEGTELRPPDLEDDITLPVLLATRQGGSGGADRGFAYDFRYWLHPLPPDGVIAFVVEWRDQGVPRREYELEAGVLHEAAARAQRLWTEPP